MSEASTSAARAAAVRRGLEGSRDRRGLDDVRADQREASVAFYDKEPWRTGPTLTV
jgi:hypothetical protein